MSSKHKILIVDDEIGILNALRRQLQDKYEIALAESGATAIELLKNQSFSLVIADQRMPGMKGVELLQRVSEIAPATLRILMTAYTDSEATIAAVNRGKIFYYLTKPWEEEELQLILDRAIEQYSLRNENEQLLKELKEVNTRLNRENLLLKETLTSDADFSRIITNDPQMTALFKTAKKVLNVDATVLIEGETGTGKELLARAIHYNGNRKDKLFITQNCAALPDTLLESELFGHVKGAFTGAVVDKKGLFEAAHEGTIFLDEIGDISPDFQVRLLRFLQEGEIKPVGGLKTKKVDVRVIAATNKTLTELVSKGKFREDLFFRISVFPLWLPPLRERKNDIALLTEYFIQKYAAQYNKKIKQLSEKVLNALLRYSFPGNIRELENIISRAVLMADDKSTIDPDMLLFPKFAAQKKTEQETTDLKDSVRDLETEMITDALRQNNGNISQTAKALKLTRQGLYKKIKRYGLSD